MLFTSQLRNVGSSLPESRKNNHCCERSEHSRLREAKSRKVPTDFAVGG